MPRPTRLEVVEVLRLLRGQLVEERNRIERQRYRAATISLARAIRKVEIMDAIKQFVEEHYA